MQHKYTNDVLPWSLEHSFINTTSSYRILCSWVVMFVIPSLISLAFGISTASAAMVPRDSSACSAFSAGSLSVPSFSLAALNTTLSNANNTGAPIVLGPNGAIDWAVFHDLATYASFPYNDYPLLTLSEGGLTAGQYIWSTGVTNNSSPSFIQTSIKTPNPAPVYCAVTDPNYGYPLLAVAGHTDLFSICQAFEGESFIRVYYNATTSEYGSPVLDTCYPVVLQIISS